MQVYAIAEPVGGCGFFVAGMPLKPLNREREHSIYLFPPEYAVHFTLLVIFEDICYLAVMHEQGCFR
jgi:hypothetical protein